jgi:hypothetical protein
MKWDKPTINSIAMNCMILISTRSLSINIQEQKVPVKAMKNNLVLIILNFFDVFNQIVFGNIVLKSILFIVQ